MAETVESERQPGRSERGIDIATRMWDERFGGSSAALACSGRTISTAVTTPTASPSAPRSPGWTAVRWPPSWRSSSAASPA